MKVNLCQAGTGELMTINGEVGKYFIYFGCHKPEPGESVPADHDKRFSSVAGPFRTFGQAFLQAKKLRPGTMVTASDEW